MASADGEGRITAQPDATVEPGGTYWYRLLVTGRNAKKNKKFNELQVQIAR
jgi:hypothetical protein